MSLAEALASLEETPEHRELRRAIADLCLDSRRDDPQAGSAIGREAMRMLTYCEGERLPRTTTSALPEDTEVLPPKTLVAVAEKVST